MQDIVSSSGLVAVDRQETDWPRRIPSEICPGRPAPARSKTWEPELGRPGRPGRTSIFSWVGAGGTHLSGSAAQSDPLPTLAQPAQPAHALVVLAPPKPDPDLLSLSSSLAPAPAALPTSLSACLPACCSCPVPAPAPAKLAISKRTDDVLSDLPLPHPQNSILWRLAYTLTLTHSRHTHPTTYRRPRRPPHPFRPPPLSDKPSSHTHQPCARRDRPLRPCSLSSTVQSTPPAR